MKSIADIKNQYSTWVKWPSGVAQNCKETIDAWDVAKQNVDFLVR